MKSLPYRKCVVCVIFKDDKYLLTQRPGWKKSWWKFPQGGVEGSENEEDTIVRELREELNIVNFRILMRSKFTLRYEWPTKIVKKNLDKWMGQEQTFYVVEYLGLVSDLKISDPAEINDFQLVEENQMLSLINHRAKVFTGYKKVIRKVLKEAKNRVTYSTN